MPGLQYELDVLTYFYNYSRTFFSVKPDPEEGCDEDHPYGFKSKGANKCCGIPPVNQNKVAPTFHQNCNAEEIYAGNSIIEFPLQISIYTKDPRK